MRKVTAAQAVKDLKQHALWLQDNSKGARLDWSGCDIDIDADLRSADLRSANLRSADLRYADLRSADLRSANLRSADLRYADLRYADLRSADLSSADLSSANLSSADLRSADLSSADLSSANLSSADLSSANLSSAKAFLRIGPIGSRSDWLDATYNAENVVYVRTGCFNDTLAEFAKAVKDSHDSNKYARQYKAAIAMIKAWHKIESEGE